MTRTGGEGAHQIGRVYRAWRILSGSDRGPAKRLPRMPGAPCTFDVSRSIALRPRPVFQRHGFHALEGLPPEEPQAGSSRHAFPNILHIGAIGPDLR